MDWRGLTGDGIGGTDKTQIHFQVYVQTLKHVCLPILVKWIYTILLASYFERICTAENVFHNNDRKAEKIKNARLSTYRGSKHHFPQEKY